MCLSDNALIVAIIIHVLMEANNENATNCIDSVDRALRAWNTNNRVRQKI